MRGAAMWCGVMHTSHGGQWPRLMSAEGGWLWARAMGRTCQARDGVGGGWRRGGSSFRLTAALMKSCRVGTWCSGIAPAQHAGGPGFNPQRVHTAYRCQRDCEKNEGIPEEPVCWLI